MKEKKLEKIPFILLPLYCIIGVVGRYLRLFFSEKTKRHRKDLGTKDVLTQL